MATFRIGQFVESTDNDLGIGNVANIDGDRVTVEYFDSPASDEHPTRTLSANSVSPAELHQETRVYFQHPATGHWHIGRSLIKTGDEYRVQFPNRKVGELPESALYVRWNRPIQDPTDHLAQQINETPYFHDGRAPFQRSLIEQRAGCAGMTGLFSSVIELEEHQIEVIRRVLEDPVQRYLLADDRGLGKTIEAGCIMRQYALDRPGRFSILVAVPEELCAQWEEELASRFLFDQHLGDSVHVVAHTDTEQILDRGLQAGMVVVDQVHQVAELAHADDPERRGIYDSIKTVADVTDKLLLLSAAGVLHNEAGYLAMLHLLDPLQYPLDDVDEFRRRIEDRQPIADAFQKVRDEADDDELRSAVDELAAHFPDDDRLATMTGQITELLDGADDELSRQELIEGIRTHVSETYRLHQRIVRTPDSEETGWLLPGRAGVETLEFDAPHLEEAQQQLERWRDAAAAPLGEDDDEAVDFGRLYRRLVEAVCGLPQALVDVVEERLEQIDGDSPTPPSFDGEQKILDDLLQIAESAAQQAAQLDALVDHLGGLDSGDKAIVFVDAEHHGDVVFDHLDDTLEVSIARHQPARHRQGAAWRAFLDSPEVQVLVCDQRAARGFNLQNSQAQLIHLDVPASPNQIEQRIGRLDRYGTGQPVESLIVTAENSELPSRLIDLLDRGYGVFDRSISPLHYLVEKQLPEQWKQFFFGGPDAIGDAVEQLGGEQGEIERQLHRTRAQSELDAMAGTDRNDDEFYDRLWDIDFDADRLEQVSYDWIRNRLQFHRVDTDHDHERILRWEYRTERTAKHPTLLPLRELLGRFAFAVDPEINGFFSYPMSFHRGTACSQGVRVARIGEPFISAMRQYSRWDDRGTSFAMWRHVPRARLDSDPQLFFRFDFIVEANVQKAVEALAGYEYITEEAARLRADGLFVPLMKSVWVSEQGEAVDDDDIGELLELPYEQEGTNRYGRDYNLNAERWERIEQLVDRHSWEETCQKVRDNAEKLLADEVSLRQRCKQCAQQAQQRHEQTITRLRTRAESAGVAGRDLHLKQLELEEELTSAIKEGIQSPSIRLDAIGAIFLSTVDPFEAEEA